METNTSQIAWHHISIGTGSLNDLDQRIAESQEKGYKLVRAYLLDEGMADIFASVGEAAAQ